MDGRGVERAGSLHVGCGVQAHARHASKTTWSTPSTTKSEATARAIARAKRDARRVIAVGTTTTRALEDAAARGDGVSAAGPGTASLFIYPGHRFRAIDGLLTNFHLPSSSLLMLVAAFAGQEKILSVREAVERRYRFIAAGMR
jgi:S-adenosylmethionine:tRNA ribosyltransferase-isomerase